MELGPIQTRWLELLESGRFGQMETKLGNVHANKYCCLGLALMAINNCGPEGLYTVGGEEVIDQKEQFSHMLGMSDSFIGLEGGEGRFHEKDLTTAQRQILDEYNVTFPKDSQILYLSRLNDRGVPFDEIAAFIRYNPDAIFTEPK